jgi:hypothetical protein
MQFGKKEETEIIDEAGSTLTVEHNFSAGVAVKPRRLHYEIRHRTDKTDLETLSQIAQGLISDFSKLDAELKLERTKTGEMQGYYTIVECYTILEY